MKLNVPAHRKRIVKVVHPRVDFPGHAGEFLVVDSLGEYPDDWVKPERRIASGGTLAECLGARAQSLFYAKWEEDQWKFLRHLPHRRMNW